MLTPRAPPRYVSRTVVDPIRLAKHNGEPRDESGDSRSIRHPHVPSPGCSSECLGNLVVYGGGACTPTRPVERPLLARLSASRAAARLSDSAADYEQAGSLVPRRRGRD